VSARFTDRVVVVTGGATGIGAATARAFAREGARVVIFDIARREGEATAAAIEEAGGTARFRAGDVTDEDAVRSAVDEAVESYGRLDVLHANAGIEWTKTVVDTSREEWQRVLDVNLTGVYVACRYALRQMIAQRSGSLVLTSSPHAINTVPDAGAYAASKGGGSRARSPSREPRTASGRTRSSPARSTRRCFGARHRLRPNPRASSSDGRRFTRSTGSAGPRRSPTLRSSSPRTPHRS
jgi:NADP-dependent 3-hydroxy acid dehydrogenase YdfG